MRRTWTAGTPGLGLALWLAMGAAGCEADRCRETVSWCDGQVRVTCYDGEGSAHGGWGTADDVREQDCAALGGVCREAGDQAACVVPDETPCAEGETRCTSDGSGYLVCEGALGRFRADPAPCEAAGEVCAEGNGHTVCAAAPAAACDAGAVSCADDGRATLRCDAATGWFVRDEACAEDEVCVLGGGAALCARAPLAACDPPDERGLRCAGDTLVYCAEAGFEAAAPCGSACRDDALGARCVVE